MTKEEKRQYNQTWYSNNKHKVKEKKKVYNCKTRDRKKEYDLKVRYNLSIEQLKQMYISQNGCCGICVNKFKNRADMHVDHDHNNNTIRNLLCRNCNMAIGLLNEDISILSKAIEYINKWNQPYDYSSTCTTTTTS